MMLFVLISVGIRIIFMLVDVFFICIMVYVEFQNSDGEELGYKNVINVPPFSEGQTVESEDLFDGRWKVESIHHIVNDDVWGILVKMVPVNGPE